MVRLYRCTSANIIYRRSWVHYGSMFCCLVCNIVGVGDCYKGVLLEIAHMVMSRSPRHSLSHTPKHIHMYMHTHRGLCDLLFPIINHYSVLSLTIHHYQSLLPIITHPSLLSLTIPCCRPVSSLCLGLPSVQPHFPPTVHIHTHMYSYKLLLYPN